MKFVYRRRQFAPSVLILITVAALALVGTAIFAKAKSAPAIDITVRNNSQREIHHIYLAVGNPDNWGPDQLNGATLPPGSTFIVNGACSGSNVRVIAEDQKGCFVYYNAACDSNQSWEITDATPPDCGG